jgi:glutamate 5-kinase
MSTKLKAAEIVTKAGIFALIGDGFDQRLTDLLTTDQSATLFLPSTHKMSSRHRWIAFSGQAQGKLVIDSGAQRALTDLGKSLLPAGIKDVTGVFKAGDMVEIQCFNCEPIARGLVNYSSDDIKLICGCKSSEIIERLGQKDFDEAVHRDNLVVL